jgi:Tfp pilus assembly protein PilF
VERTPGWGAAEAYTYLGRGYLERGDVLNARDALERALLIAPDFAMAKRLLTKITTG